jgi:hypothetical protein
VRVELEPAGGEAARRQHDPVGAASLLAQPDADAQRAYPRTRALGADDDVVQQHAAARPAQRVAQCREDAHARHRRRQRRDLEDAPAEPVLERRPGRVRVGDAEHGGERDALLGCQPAGRDLGHDLAAEARVVKGAGEAERVDVGAALGHEVELDGARGRGRTGAREPVGEQRRVEVLERPEADHADRRRVAQVAAGHRRRDERRRSRHADRGRQQHVLLQPAAVGVGGERPAGDALGEPVERRGDAVGADAGVGVVRPLGHQCGQRLARALDALGCVAEHVDRAGAQVRRADALGDHEHARSGLGDPHRGRQPREPGADHDHVVVAHFAASAAGTASPRARCSSSGSLSSPGRCSTSSSPWKIQSSRRAWRSWSP